MIKENNMKLEDTEACIREMRTLYRCFIVKSEEKTPVGRHKRRW